MPKIYSRFGGNQRPPLIISDVPDDAQSLAIICFDPDAPFGRGFYHWIIWNIPPSTTKVTNEYLPQEAVEGINSWGRRGYYGPQPPFGTHRYQFTVYALDATIDLPVKTKPQKVYEAIAPHSIDKAKLTGRFGAFDIFGMH